MSELKSYNSERIYWAVEQVEREAGDIDDLHLDDNLFYIKSDVDPVIAELNAQADFLKTTRDSCGNCNKCADGMGKVLNAELDKWKTQLRRNKYKRCLAMAKWCRSRACFYDTMRENNLYWGMKSDRAYKWHKRWLKIAEKFKEATK